MKLYRPYRMIKEEFQLKNLAFYDCKKERLLFSQFPLPQRQLYPLYRFFTWLYMCAWLIGHAIDYRVQGTFHWYLTNWAEVIHVFYLLIAFISSMYGYVKSPQDVAASNNNNASHLSLFFKLQWLSFSITADIVIVVVVLFWALAAPTLPPSAFKEPIIYHLHLVNLIMLLLDIFMVAVPVRLLHFVYGIATTLVYVLSTLILHWLGIISDIYPGVLDWQNNPTKAILYCLLGVGLVAIAHVFVFGLYKLRMFLSSRIHKVGKSPTSNFALNLPQSNGDVMDQGTQTGAAGVAMLEEERNV